VFAPACLHQLRGEQLSIEDLNSANGTYINRNKLYPGQKKQLSVNDIIQIGNVQMKLIV
jgi:pSer/pThr/pTyr-binding forkhead associated (FHA) protein